MTDFEAAIAVTLSSSVLITGVLYAGCLIVRWFMRFINPN